MSVGTPGSSVLVGLTDEAKDDVRRLTPDVTEGTNVARDRFAEAVMDVLRQIKEHPWVGTPLREEGPIEGLGDLRKVAFDPEGTMPPGYRLVYVLEPEEEHPQKAEVIAIGNRASMEVYKIASKRMKGRRGRPPGRS
mgnify:CR=1 FL=1